MLETIFGLSLLYAGVVSTVIALIMSTADKPTFVDKAFTVREWWFVFIFVLTGGLIVLDIPRSWIYAETIIISLNIIVTIVLIAILSEHKRWREENCFDEHRTPGAIHIHTKGSRAIRKLVSREVHTKTKGE